MTHFAQELRQILAQPTCIVGVGNPLRNDDAVGALIAERLAPELAAAGRHTVINAEDVIENYCFSIADSAVRNVLVIDAVQGAWRRSPAHWCWAGWRTWKRPAAAIRRINSPCPPPPSVLRHHGKDVWLLGIVAANTDYGTAVSQEILASAEAVIDLVSAHSKEF